MPLEETKDLLMQLRNEAVRERDSNAKKRDKALSSLEKALYGEGFAGWDEHVRILDSTLHHLEAGKESTAFLEWLLANCKIIHWPGGGHYPIEHAPAAKKESVWLLKMAMNKQGMYAGPVSTPTEEPQG